MAIINNVPTTNPAALQFIEQSSYDFYLGGSRKMSQLETLYVNGIPQLRKENLITIQSITDYDFYATYSGDIERMLKHNGFVETNRSYNVRKQYDPDADILGPNLINIDVLAQHKPNEYELDNEAIMILEKDNVQVVLRKDAEFYRMVFENISVRFYYDYLWKSAPHIPDRSKIQPIFNQLFATAHAAQRGTKQ